MTRVPFGYTCTRPPLNWPARSLDQSTALLVGDSGSERATGAQCVEALDPRIALVSVGARYGPAPAILDRLSGRTILRTDLNGTVRVFTDGEQMRVETER